MLACFLCASDLVISASCLASRLICFCFTSCTFWLRKLQHLVRHLLFFAYGKGASFTYMALVLKCTLLGSAVPAFWVWHFACYRAFYFLQSQGFFLKTSFWETLFFTSFFVFQPAFFLLKMALPPRFTLVSTRPKGLCQKKSLQENPPAYIYRDLNI